MQNDPSKPRTEWAVEYVRWLMEEIAQFNRADLKTLTLFENGKPLQIPPEAFDTFRFTGLSNKEFVGLEFWRHFDES